MRERRILWTYHVNMRLQGRYIPRQVIFKAVDTYEIIEAYPQDKYPPSYLVLAQHTSGAFHALFATDIASDNVRVVTAYRPSPDEWSVEPSSKQSTAIFHSR